MKKWIGMLLAVMLTAGALAGCGDSKKDHPLGLYLGDKLMVEIGMDKETVDKNFSDMNLEIGEPDELISYDDEQVYVGYTDNLVTHISANSSKYTDNKKLCVGANMEMVKMVYEEGEMIVHENSSVAMGYDANKQILMNVDLKDEQVHYEKRYDCFDIVDWVLQKENYKPDDIIKGIVIYDYKKSKPEVDKDLLTVE